MVNLTLVIHLVTAFILLLVTIAYLVEFSYRNKNYSKIKDNNKSDEYKGLRLEKSAGDTYYSKCMHWYFNNLIDMAFENIVHVGLHDYLDEYDFDKMTLYDPINDQIHLNYLSICNLVSMIIDNPI